MIPRDKNYTPVLKWPNPSGTTRRFFISNVSSLGPHGQAMGTESCNYNYVVIQHENKKENGLPNTVTIIGMALSSCVNEIVHFGINLNLFLKASLGACSFMPK